MFFVIKFFFTPVLHYKSEIKGTNHVGIFETSAQMKMAFQVRAGERGV
jgi:hypothetical protein